MKIMIDTDVIIAAVLFPESDAALAFEKALRYEPVICDHTFVELHRKFRQRWPEKMRELEEFLTIILSRIRLVETPGKRGIAAAKEAHADLLLTGDTSIQGEHAVSPEKFLQM